MTRAARALALLLILAAPLGEGGRLPGALAALHSAALALILLAGLETLSRPGAGRPRGRGIGFLLVPVAALMLACLSAARAAYPYAAWLGMMDRLAFVGALLGGALLLRALPTWPCCAPPPSSPRPSRRSTRSMGGGGAVRPARRLSS